jgi:hypothetical protein
MAYGVLVAAVGISKIDWRRLMSRRFQRLFACVAVLLALSPAVHAAGDRTYLDCTVDGASHRVGYILDRKAKLFTVAGVDLPGSPLFEDDTYVGVRIEHDGIVMMSILINKYTLRYSSRSAAFPGLATAGGCQVAEQKL